MAAMEKEEHELKQRRDQLSRMIQALKDSKEVKHHVKQELPKVAQATKELSMFLDRLEAEPQGRLQPPCSSSLSMVLRKLPTMCIWPLSRGAVWRSSTVMCDLMVGTTCPDASRPAPIDLSAQRPAPISTSPAALPLEAKELPGGPESPTTTLQGL